MTKVKDEKENTLSQSTYNNNNKKETSINKKIHRTTSINSINRKTKQLKNNFFTLKNQTESTKLNINTQINKNRRLSLNPNTLLKLATSSSSSSSSTTTKTESSRRKSISNPFNLNQNTEKLKRFKSKIDYLKVETLNNYDQKLKQIKNEFDNNKKNDELNNKIDLEIRILDGILKLLNAISTAPISSSSQSTSGVSQLTTFSNPLSNSSTTPSTNQVNQFDAHIAQILTACKCLFVSHRKIAIYLNNLNDLSLTLNTNTNKNCKLYLSNIRIPLSWKWNDYIKASKNSENVNSKYAVFALIYLGNMIYDTQLLSNIDATCTEINFNENFIFEDANIDNFELRIEVYSYEIFNTTTNNLISQSARKLAKHLSDFVKKSNLPPLQQQQNNLLSSNACSSNNQSSQSSILNNDPYSYSAHRFKLCAQTTLKPEDISENIETRNLQIINENLDQYSGSCLTLNNVSTNNQQTINKLPLFDQFSVQLRSSPLPNSASNQTNFTMTQNLDEIF